MSPPLTLGLAGWAVARSRPWPDGRHVPFVFNVQDVFPDVAIDLGMLTHPGLVAAARRLERVCYARADAITVLSEDLRDNVATRVSDPAKVRVIHNFVDTEAIRPLERDNGYRREHGLEGRFVIMYAGNVGLSQSLELLLESARALADDQRVAFVINGQGAARAELERKARGLDNVRFVDLQPPERVPELLAAADVHVVPLKRGLTRSSVPSKALSVLAAGRPLVASVDPGSELARLCERSGAGVAVPPEDVEAFTAVLRRLVDAPDEARRMGEAGRAYAQTWASPEAVARRYEELLLELLDARRPAP